VEEEDEEEEEATRRHAIAHFGNKLRFCSPL
jgi:hypothetical protein